MSATKLSRRRGPKPDRRRALELLAGSRDGMGCRRPADRSHPRSDNRCWPADARGSHADARLPAYARGSNDSVREKLAAGAGRLATFEAKEWYAARPTSERLPDEAKNN